MDQDDRVGRRGFLKGTAALGTIAAGASVGGSSANAAPSAEKSMGGRKAGKRLRKIAVEEAFVTKDIAALIAKSIRPGSPRILKAVYIDKRELKCACVGGSSNVPLGFVSLTENLMMVGMALWMLAEASL